MRCEDAPEEAADLARPECLRAVLRHLREGGRARGVVLVHDREKAYGPRAMAVLESLLALGRLLDQCAQRAPSPDFPRFTAKEVAAVCAKCEFRPAALFTGLRDRLLGDPGDFLSALTSVTAKLADYGEAGCATCADATVQDLAILLRELPRVPGGR